MRSFEISGRDEKGRVPSKEMDARIQAAVKGGEKHLTIDADGQHGIGGRIWPSEEGVTLEVNGYPGQRLGGMGMLGTKIVVNTSASDDVGWVNCGAEITVLGDVSNGAHNAGAQGKLYVQGGGGARCDTLTKFNPRFAPVESWYFRDVGDSFAEFKAGGIAVVCGVDPRNPENILGYRSCVGMVGGTIYFRGPVEGVSEKDARIAELTDADWEWLTSNFPAYLEAIDRAGYLEELTKSKEDWKKIVSLTPQERVSKGAKRLSMEAFRQGTWEPGVGKGGIFADYLDIDHTIIPYVVTGENRRFVPSWDNDRYAPPCAYNCPTGIPTHERTKLIREGKEDAALDLVLRYSPFPGTVCGYVCPNLCMESCTRSIFLSDPVDVTLLGRLSIDRPAPAKEKARNEKVSVVGGGPAGLSAAYQLALKGYNVSLYEGEDNLGGKIHYCIPEDRLPGEVLSKELSRFKELGVDIHLSTKVDADLYHKIHDESDAVILATGSHSPRTIPFPGYEHVLPGIVFLKEITAGIERDLSGKKVVVIGAGNVGMDICVEAFNCGAAEVVAVDIQKPASFGKEQKMAAARGATIQYPKFTDHYDFEEKKIHFTDGTYLDADLAIISIGETPELEYLPKEVDLDRGHIRVDSVGQSNDPKVFAIGDVTKPGLITNAIGDGVRVAEYVHSLITKTEYEDDKRTIVPYEKLSFEWFDREREGGAVSCSTEGGKCMSCGSCRDCHICEHSCYWNAISRVEHDNGTYEYVVDSDKCIGCGFCAGVCPCGIWELSAAG
ncbi:MAG: 4Fe-4S ferredoxin [Deltaproteobacteria bacterium]|nr:MAG: 4Fe-4S ferredoxin [Deltaproteobacteria bacterium]